MAKRIDTTHVVKLTGDNYEVWKLQISLVLKAADVWGYVDGSVAQPAATADADVIATWKKEDTIAQAILVPTLSMNQVSHVFKCSTSKEMFNKLRDVNADNSTLNKQHTLTTFLNYSIKGNSSVVAAYLEVEQLARNLNDMGVNIDEVTTVTKIVSCLPENSFHAFKKAWDSVPEVNQTMTMLLARLKKEELSNKTDSNEQKVQTMAYAAFNKHPQAQIQAKERGNIQDLKKKTTCNNCGKMGHWARECRGPKQNNEFKHPRDRRDQPERRPVGNPMRKEDRDHHVRHQRDERNQHDHHDRNRRDDRDQQDRREERNHFRGPPRAFVGFNSEQSDNDQQYRRDDRNHHDGPAKAYVGFQPETICDHEHWISDSGATTHICGDIKWFSQFHKFENPKTVGMTDKNEALALGTGTVTLEAKINDNWVECTVHNVLFMPGAVNLFSECVMSNKGFTIIRTQDKTIYYEPQGDEGLTAIPHNGLFIMQFRAIKPMALLCKAKLWHNRLAHINMKYIQDTIAKEAAYGIDPKDLREGFDCDNCHFGKEARKPFPEIQAKRNSSPGEMLHSDLSGKMPTSSLGGANYFMVIKDDCTGFRAVYFLQTKSQTKDCIQEFINFMETQTGNTVKSFRSDNGTEFLNQDLSSYFKTKGIRHETTAPYCPESNGRAEREMRTIKDTARAMLTGYKLPEFLWAEAVATAVYILNRVLNKMSPNKTAFEIIFNRKPNLKHLHVFGCKAFAQVPKEKRKVWDPKAKLYAFVGYDGDSQKFRLYDPTNRIIVVARNVSFIEDGLEDYSTIKLSHPSTTMTIDHSEEATESTRNNSYPEPPTAPQVQPSKMTITVRTPKGSYETTVPAAEATTIRIPRAGLRDRSKLCPPDRFRANAAILHYEPNTYTEACECPASEEWMKAMKEEMQSHADNGTWVLVNKPHGARPLDCRWVFKIKTNKDQGIERYKARLVIKGYKQQFGIDYFETFAAVCRYESTRILLALAVSKDMFIKQFDVKTAFLNGDLQEEIYMKHPPGFETGHPEKLCLLKKTLYGLKQAPRSWNAKLSTTLQACSLQQSSSDPCVYFGKIHNEFVYLVIHVDDGLLFSRSSSSIQQILNQLSQQFTITVSEPTTFVGIEIFYRKAQGIMNLTQGNFIKTLIEKFRMSDCKPASTPMQPNTDLKPAEVCPTNIPYRELIGSLLFLARTTRPDIAYAISRLSQFCTCYDENSWNHAKTVLRYLQGTIMLGLEYKRTHSILANGFTDSDYAGDKNDRKSHSGFVFFIDKALISWGSQKQSIVTLSSTEAEYVALANGVKEAIWLRNFLVELGYPQKEPTPVQVDNQSAIRLAHNPEFHNRTKHIDVRFHFIRNLVTENEISVPYVPTDQQAADIMTKPLLKEKHGIMKTLLGLKPFLMTTLMFLSCFCILIGPTHGITTQNNAPVIWRKTPAAVTVGAHPVHVSIRLVSPCKMLSNATVHYDLVDEAKEACNRIYQNTFMVPLEKMCPQKRHTEVFHHMTKRFIPLIFGAILLVNFAVVALGITGTIMGSLNSQSINEQNERLDILERKFTLTDAKLEDLRKSFNSALSRLNAHQTDFDELKSKTLSTNFAVSYITSRLLDGKAIITEATRQWKDGILHPPFVDFFNLTLPCGDDCPLKYSTPQRCELSDDRSTLYLDFTTSLVNRALIVLEADPFELMLKKTETQETCRITYNGPKNAILSLNESCIYTLNIKRPVVQELILSPSRGCKPADSFPEDTSYFTVHTCQSSHEKDEYDFVQVKLTKQGYNVYCPYSSLTIAGRKQPCPFSVFLLPLTSDFSINEHEFVGSRVDIHHEEVHDPDFTLKVNWHIRPTFNWSIFEVPKQEDPVIASHHETLHHYSFGFIAGCLLIIFILIAALVYFVRRKAPMEITVTAQPAGPAVQPAVPDFAP